MQAYFGMLLKTNDPDVWVEAEIKFYTIKYPESWNS